MSEAGGQGIKGLESVSTGGEDNTGANVGAGVGLIFRDKTGVIINFKSLIAGSGMTINNNPDDIELIASGAGEANTISSLGGGTVQLVATIPKLLVDLRVKSLSVSAPINVTDVADLITLALDPLVNADIAAGAAIAISKLAALTANRALETDGAGLIIASPVTSTELNLLSGRLATILTTGQADIITGNKRFDNLTLRIRNPAGIFDYIITSSAIGGSFNATLPLLLAADTFLFNITAAIIQELDCWLWNDN